MKVAGFAALAIAALQGCAARESGSHASAAVGQPAPAFSESAVPKGTISLAALRGKPIYLNFFATWCPPCNEEAPDIDRLQREFASLGLQIVGVDVLENARKAELFRAQHHLSYPAVVDDGTLRKEYDVNGLPVHVFIDRQGIVRRIVAGEMTAAEMREAVLKLVHEGPHPPAAY
jgi:cytochrome c biogenesis protein CcmG, thiol:disulfide interchange protein DsbE